jgi:hypothetical protein
MAEDMVLGGSVEIGVGCDNTSTAPGNTGGPDVLGTNSCVVNEVILQQDPASLTSCVLPALGCILNAGTCTDPTTLTCGSDGTTDSINFGEGGGHADPTSSGLYNEDGVPYPAPANGCSNLGGNGQVYVIAGIRAEAPAVTDLAAGTDGVGVSLSLIPEVGFISQVTPGPSLPACGPSTLSIDGAPDYRDHDADYFGVVRLKFSPGPGRALTTDSVTAGGTGKAIHGRAGQWLTSSLSYDLKVNTYTYNFATQCYIRVLGAPESFTGSYTGEN